MTIPVGAKRPFFQQSRRSPEVIAHRGGGGEWPEETIYGCQKALEIGVDVLEIDVHKTLDGELVVMHNRSVDETTDGSGEIKDLKIAEIKQLNAAHLWNLEKQKNTEVPTLEEVFQAFPNQRMNVEIKPRDLSVIERLTLLIEKYQMKDKILIASGWNSVLHDFRRECADVATSASVLEIEEFEALAAVMGFDYRPDTDAIQWHSKLIVKIITKDFVDKAHELNLVVHAWTVNEPDEMRRMVSLGVDGIITDYPSTLLRVLGQAQ
jgi:glycerophosphoryl diester phosphodiesterase